MQVGQPAIGVDLAVTRRTGLSRFTFPATANANVLFKAADSAAGSDAAAVHVVGSREVAGWVTSGHFCDTPGSYRLFFDAAIRPALRPLRHLAGHERPPGRRDGSGSRAGAVVTFDATRDRTVEMKVGISFVSGANARANLAAENADWSVGAVRRAARSQWNALLGRIAVTGGTPAEQQTFYSALYHSFLHPNVFSDANGAYPGFDGRVHTASGYTQYANFSGWDIYRSEVQFSRSSRRRRRAT